MNSRIAKWEDRYARGEGFHGFAPSPPLELAASLVAPGRALDIASGAGRHALYLAERGWYVVAVEGAQSGIDVMQAEARRRGIDGRIDATRADIESRPREFRIEPGRYDLVCDFYFLDRSLFEELREGVRPGGLFVGAIHLDVPSAADSTNPAFLLAPGELGGMAADWGWEILPSHEGPPREGGHNRSSAELIARRPA